MAGFDNQASPQLVGLLNQLVQLHSRSLPTYLASARPWMPTSDHQASDVLEAIAEDHKERVNQFADYILDLGGLVQLGEFPMEYTDLHDLSCDYLLKVVAKELEDDVQRLTQLVAALSIDARSRALAEEALGAAKGHLQSVHELTGSSAAPHASLQAVEARQS